MLNQSVLRRRVEGVCLLFVLLLMPVFPAFTQEAQPAVQQTASMQAPSPEFAAAMKLYRQRRYTDAIAAFEAITAADSQNAAAYYFAGYAHYVQHHLNEAQDAFGKAFAVDPRFDPRPYFRAR